MGHTRHLSPIDQHHLHTRKSNKGCQRSKKSIYLVAFVEPGNASVGWGLTGDPGHDHRHPLIGTALHVEPKPALCVGQDGHGDDARGGSARAAHLAPCLVWEGGGGF